ncbi:UNVERIFIED_CONTAM: hypothetical protein Sradi_6975800 [Sesamum radiatum]|uniref:CCHC-type domain-containing protein n=1 Tax=Sesamum radiatum TaxID=300843 RepID=A0AAW2JFQ2_SESRA
MDSTECNACMSLGHPTKECPTTRPRQPPVSVYVQKTRPHELRESNTDELKRMESGHGNQQPQPPVRKHILPKPKPVVERQVGKSVEAETAADPHEDKGKATIIYNAFDMLTELDGDIDGLKGPISSPTTHVDD